MTANAAEQLSQTRPDWSRVVFFNSDAQPTNTLLNPRPRQEEGLLSLLLISRRTCFDFVTRSLIQFAVFRVEAKKQQPKKNPKHCPAFSLHRHSCSPLTQWWYQCCSALSRLPEMICRFYWLHLKIFTGCCSTTNPGLTCRLADPLRLFTHKRATGFCSMWIRTGSTVRRRPLSCRHSEEFCCREKLNFNKCSLTSRREQKLKRSVVSLLGCVTLITLSRSNTIVGLNRIYMARWEKCCKKAFRAQEEKRLHIVWAKWPHEKITDQ